MIDRLFLNNGISRMAVEERERLAREAARKEILDAAETVSVTQIVGRMMVLIERQIAGLEDKLKTDGLMSDSQLRQLETVSKTIDKLIALDTASAKGAQENANLDPELVQIRDRLIAKVKALDTE